jgi:hypothetical protein
MSNEALNWAFKQEVKPASKKLILISLADSADDFGFCWPSYETIAGKCSLTRRAVIKQIKELISENLLNKTRRVKKSGDDTSNAYQLNLGLNVPDDHPLKEVVNRIHPPSEQNSPLGVNSVHPNPNITNKNKKTRTREEFLRSIQEGYQANFFEEFKHLTETEIILSAEACLDFYGAKGDWPAGDPVLVLRHWIRGGIKNGHIRKAPKEQDASSEYKEPENPLQGWHQQIKPLVSEAVFRAWLRPTAYRDGKLYASTKFAADYIRMNLLDQINKVLPGVDVTHNTHQPQKELEDA